MRISATNLESFRLFMTGDWMEEAALIASLKGEFVPTPAVQLGHAYHSVLEHPEVYRVKAGYSCEGFQFDDATMQPMLDLIDRRGVFEVKGTKQIENITLVAQADQLVGANLYEFKTTSGTFDVDKYMQSYQWRVMALVFEPLAITYRVAVLYESRNGAIELKSIETLPLYPYVGLHEDCCDLVREFAHYVSVRGLDGFLRERQRLAEVG